MLNSLRAQLNQLNFLSNFFNKSNEIVTGTTIIGVRNFQPKVHGHHDGTYRGDNARRFGYEAHHHTKGCLPRLSIKEKRLRTLPMTAKEDNWSRRQALMGQNDFISVFTDKRYDQQYELLDHVPDYLKGMYAKREYSVLQKKRREFEHWSYTKPLKWLHLEQRIKFLYRRINNKYKPPNVELLSPSRHQPV